METHFWIDAKDSFEQIFSFNVAFEGKQSDYSTQFFYGFHNDVPEEKSFWENTFPFTFVSFIQFADRSIAKYKAYLESQDYRKGEIRALGLAGQSEDVRVLAYHALDSSDIILVIKCRYSATGTQMINNLHQDVCNEHPFSVRNSYSILAINREYIEEDTKTILLEEPVEWLELRVIEKMKGSVNGLYKELWESLSRQNPDVVIKRKGMMGTEDEVLTVQKAQWRDILPLYREETCILMNSNHSSQKYASAITTKMHYSIISGDTQSAQGADAPAEPTPFCDYLYHLIERIYYSSNNVSAYTERKNLVMLVNALRKIEYSNRTGKTFNDYCFYPIMMPAAMLIRLREKDDDNAAEFYQFIKYVKLCVQNFTKPDRVYQQITDFNIRYFDAPAKLVALYNAYVYYAKQILNVGSEGQYEFLLCPGMNRKTEVKELYQGTAGKAGTGEMSENRKSHHLFRVEIPEAHIYNLKLMFFTLGHEVSHFVGRVIRKREDRYESILKLVGRMTAIGLKEQIGYINVFADECFDDKIWARIESKIYTWIRFHVEGHLSREYMEGSEYNPDFYTQKRIMEQIDYYKNFYRHTSTLKILLNRAVDKILHEVLKKCFDSNWLQELVGILKEQKHGTVVILTDDTNEVERLCILNRGTLIADDKEICTDYSGWNREQLLSLTSIDGALFMDLRGTCTAIGVIVDGVATRIGDTGKGARYNSVVNYVRQKDKSMIYLGIIVSEDGMIKLTCNLQSKD